MDPKIFNLFGLLLCAAGAILLAYGLIVPDGRALEIGLPRMAAESDKQNVYLPHVRDRMRESRLASVGIVLMTVGFLLQVVGNWQGLDSRPAELLAPAAQYVKCS